MQHTLHYIALHYNTLHYIAFQYITVHFITLHYTTLHSTTWEVLPTPPELMVISWEKTAYGFGLA